MAAAGLDLVADADIDEAHALVMRLIGPPVASIAVLRSVHSHTQASLFVFREGRITGLLAELPLTQAGLAALTAGRFNGLEPLPEQIARPGQDVVAYYCWGNAAETRRAAAATVRGMVIARDEIYPELPHFARAAVPADRPGAASNGARISFRRFDCTYYPGQPDLLFSPKSRSARSPAA
jgi:hypothetical protein